MTCAWQILPGKAAMMTAKATTIAPLPFTRTREAGTAPPIEIGGPAKAAMQPLPDPSGLLQPPVAAPAGTTVTGVAVA